MVKRVHLVFKTHLDIGFTDLAAATVERYLTQFIPNAIATAQHLRELGGRERLVWTTGSWLIDRYFLQANQADQQKLCEAIEAGDITWHALPFTTHTELMSKKLFTYGLSLSKSLDARFSHKTIAAKMTDVPGHTLAMIPLLSQNGVAFLHLGVNGGSQVPDVPPLFRWHAPTGEEVLVQYDASYGSKTAFEGLEDVLIIENSADNSGPPSVAEVLSVYERLTCDYPEATILASNLSSYANAILPFAENFPLITQEIGDTWIHGVGSDPKKVSTFKLLLRLIEQWEEEEKLYPGAPGYDGCMKSLLMIPEHTWGLDFKKYLADYKHWSVEDFHQARNQDLIGPDAIPEAYQFIEDFARKEYEHVFPGGQDRRKKRSYSFFESAHQEQRSYLDQAIQALPFSLQQESGAALALLLPCPCPHGAGMKKLSPTSPLTLGKHTIRFASDGSLCSLMDEQGNELVGEKGIGVYRYESFSAASYEQYHHTYNRDFEKGKNWILADFGKPGMETVIPSPLHALYAPVLSDLFLSKKEGLYEVIGCLRANEETPLGAPKKLVLRYSFTGEGQLRGVVLDWFDKEATRLPEALWLTLDVKVERPEAWNMVKMGLPLSLNDTVSLGSRSLHAVEALEYVSEDVQLTIKNLDSPLVSLGERKLLQFDDLSPTDNGCFHFNLYNNIWGTNFPLWYEENGRSRVVVQWGFTR